MHETYIKIIYSKRVTHTMSKVVKCLYITNMYTNDVLYINKLTFVCCITIDLAPPNREARSE